MKRKKRTKRAAVSPAYEFGVKLAAGAGPGLSSPAPWTQNKTPAPSLSGSAPSRGAFMQGGFKTPAVPKPLSATKPAAPSFRGENEIGAVGWSQTRAPHMKTWGQLNREQSVDPNNTAPRYGVFSSLGNGLRGFGGMAGGAGMNLVGTVIGRPVAWAVDNAAGLAGYNPGAQEWTGDALAFAQDLRDRGTHQFLYNSRSTAMDDMLTGVGDRVKEHTPAMSTAYDVAHGSANILPQLGAGSTAFGAGSKLVRAARNLPGAARVLQPAAQMIQKTPEPVRKGLTYATGVPFANVSARGATGAWAARLVGHSAASSYDAANAEAGHPTNYRYLFPAEQAYTAAFNAVGNVDDTVTPMLSATVTQDAAGQNVALMPDGKTIPFSQLSPEQANAVLSNEKNLETAQQTFTEVPNNLKSPTDRFLSGTGQDPYAETAQQGTGAVEEQPQATPYADMATYADPADRANLYQRAGLSPFAAAYTTLPDDQKQWVDSLTQNAQPLGQSDNAQATANPTVSTAASTPTESAPPVAEFKLPDGTPPEVTAQVDAGMQTVKESPDAPLAVEALQEPDGPAAAEMNQRGAQNMITEAAKDPNNPPPTGDPNAYGSWLGGVMDNYEKMDPAAKIALGLGLGLGLIGLLSSFSEEGGVGGFLAAALGIGVAGATAASGGLLGAEAQQTVGAGVRGIANMMGAGIPEGAQDLSGLLKGPDAVGGSAWDVVNGGVDQKLQQAEQLKKLTSLPKVLALSLLRNLDPKNIKTPADAELAYSNAMQIRQQLDDPNSALSRQLATGQMLSQNAAAVRQGVDTAKNVASDWWNKAKSTFGG